MTQPPDEVLPCGCICRCTDTGGVRTFTLIPCRMSCVNLQATIALAAEFDRPITYLQGTMTTFADACHRPFANGTEQEVWMNCWCRYCANDHGIHTNRIDQPVCDLPTAVYIDEWPEGWIPEPDDGRHGLPSWLICTAFTPCQACGGDPAANRTERIADVIGYWANHRD